jgi:hypothetical protein
VSASDNLRFAQKVFFGYNLSLFMNLKRRQFLQLTVGSGQVTLAGCNRFAAGNRGRITAPFDAQQATLVPDKRTGYDRTAQSVALADDVETAFIGIMGKNPQGLLNGAVHVFSRSEGSWRQQTTLVPDESSEDSYFASEITVTDDGRTVLVGSLSENNENGQRAGAAYVFTSNDGSWTQQTNLLPNDGDSGDLFGRSVAVADGGSTALIGAVADEDPNGENAGSAYVFASNDGSWTQHAKLVPTEGDEGGRFGTSVALANNGSAALLGAPLDDDPNGNESGSVYVFTRNGESWIQQAKLVPEDGDSNDEFGDQVAVTDDGRTALIGALLDEDPNGEGTGAAYVFSQNGDSWTQQAKLLAENGYEDEYFGRSVAIANDGSTALIGAYNNRAERGSVYVFTCSGNSWTQRGKLAPDDSDHSGVVGKAVTLADNGSAALLGAPFNADSTDRVAAYVFD